jgi:hypothetical protein
MALFKPNKHGTFLTFVSGSDTNMVTECENDYQCWVIISLLSQSTQLPVP